MASDTAFVPQGNTVCLNAAVAAPIALQAPGGAIFTGQNYEIINAGTVGVVLGYGQTAAIAAANAAQIAAGTSGPGLYLIPATDKIFQFPPGSYFTGTTASGTSLLYITPGDGI